MPGYKRPGVFVEETLTPANASSANGASTAAFVGTYGRGLTTPTYVSSFTDFTNRFGPIDPAYDLGFAVFTFFGNGGGGAWVARVADNSGSPATLTLSDRAASPVATLSASAISPGAWGNSLYIAVSDTSISGRFTLSVYHKGTSDQNVVETFPDVSMNAADPRYVVNLVNSQSNFITLTNLASATAAPNNAPSTRAASAGNAVLSAGSDGSVPDASDFLATLQEFDTVEGPLVFNLPGVSSTTTLNNIIGYCEARGDCYLVIDPGVGRSVSQVGTDFSGATSSSYAAVYYPRLQILDPVSTTPNVLRTVAPGGAVLGAIMRTDATSGPFQPPAGVIAGLLPAASVERRLTPSDLDELATNNPPINAIRPVPNAGICIMGARTLKSGYADTYVNVRRSLIYIRKSLIDLTQFALFEPNDQRLWDRITSVCWNWLNQYYQQGGLAGANSDQAFYVVCDDTVNTPASIAAGAVYVEIGVALQYPAEFLVLRLGQYDGGSASLTEVS